MFFRKVKLSRECMDWLEKSESFDVKKDKAEEVYHRRCLQIQDDVLKALTTVSKEPASEDGKTEVVVEVRLAKAEGLDAMMVITRVYAVVHTNNKRKYYVALDKNRQLKKFFKMSKDMLICINEGDYVEMLKTLKSKTYRISM